MADIHHDHLKFRYQNLSFALELKCVDRVIRAVALIRPSDLPASVIGVFNYHGTLIPLLTIYGKRQKEIVEPETIHRYILVRTPFRTIAILADSVDGICRLDETEIVDARSVDPDFYADRVFTRRNDVVFIYDIEKFLDREDDILISGAIEKIQTSDRL